MATALFTPFQNQRPGNDAVELMTASHEMLQPGEIVECCGPLGSGRGGVKHVDRPSGNDSSGKTEFSTGHVLGHGWVARFQSQKPYSKPGNAYALRRSEAKPVRGPVLEHSAMARQHLKIGGSVDVLRSPMIAHVLPR